MWYTATVQLQLHLMLYLCLATPLFRLSVDHSGLCVRNKVVLLSTSTMKADLHLAKLEDLYGIIAGKLDQRGVGWDISGELARTCQDGTGSLISFTKASAQAHKKIYRAVGTKLPSRALCLGLGTLTLSENRATPSIVQLYAFQAMIAAFDIPTTKISMHDPMFTATDKKFLTSFGFSLPETAAAARAELICKESTFVFAPFLPFRVLELIFKQNWEQGYLENVLLCGPELSGWLNDQ